MKKILVSGASGIVGYGILRSLRTSGLSLQLIGSTIYDDSVAQGFCDIFEKAPSTSDDSYLDWLLGAIKRHRIDLLIAGIEADMYRWTECKSQIEAAGAKIAMNTVDLIEQCRDKWNFYTTLQAANSPFAIETEMSPDFNFLQRKFGLPFLLKPRKGFGSKGIVRIDSEDFFLKHRDSIGSVLMAQPIVGNDNEEYTTSAFGDGQGNFYCMMTMKRKLSRDGFTDKAEVADVPGMEKAIHTLCKMFKPVGPTNFQFRLEGEQLKLLEINPRISSSTSIRTAFGYNESKMTVEYYLANKIPEQPAIKRGRAVRYVDDFIFYA